MGTQAGQVLHLKLSEPTPERTASPQPSQDTRAMDFVEPRLRSAVQEVLGLLFAVGTGKCALNFDRLHTFYHLLSPSLVNVCWTAYGPAIPERIADVHRQLAYPCPACVLTVVSRVRRGGSRHKVILFNPSCACVESSKSQMQGV